MKKLLAIAFIFLFSFNAKSQKLFEIGVLGGVNFPNLKIENNSSLSDISTDNGFGWHLGVMTRINVLLLYVQPEVLYTQTSTDYSMMKDGFLSSGSYTMSRLDVPIPIGIRLGPAAIFAGPVASFMLSSPNEIFDNSYKTGTWGYQIGAGLKLLGVLLEVKYEGPFNSNASSATIEGEEFDLDTRTDMWMVSLGYFFGEKRKD